MRYRLLVPVTCPPDTAADELQRLLTHARELTMTTVVVGPPYKPLPVQAWVLDTPSAVAEVVEHRMFPILLGREDGVDEIEGIPDRPEWTHAAVLRPRADARPLTHEVFDGWASACVDIRWQGQRCGGLIRCCAEDLDRVKALTDRGWNVRVLPAAIARGFSRLLGTATFNGAPWLCGPSGGSAPATAASAGPDAPDASAVPALIPAPAPAAVPFPAMPAVLAQPGSSGLLLGTTAEGAGIELAWRALELAIDAPLKRQRQAVLAQIGRAFAQRMGVLAIVPRPMVNDGGLAPFAQRLRILDSKDLWSSPAIPWRMIERPLLAPALSRAGINRPLPAKLPAEFGELLHELGAGHLATETLLGLTARPGDDLAGVLAAGGGVLLLDNGDGESELLGNLLLAACGPAARAGRPLLIIRPPHVTVPGLLEDCAIQLVLGCSRSALATLQAGEACWQLIPADGAAPLTLHEDLGREPSANDENVHDSLVATLNGPDGQPAAPATDDWYSGAPVDLRALSGGTPAEAFMDEQPGVEPYEMAQPASDGADAPDNVGSLFGDVFSGVARAGDVDPVADATADQDAEDGTAQAESATYVDLPVAIDLPANDPDDSSADVVSIDSAVPGMGQPAAEPGDTSFGGAFAAVLADDDIAGDGALFLEPDGQPDEAAADIPAVQMVPLEMTAEEEQDLGWPALIDDDTVLEGPAHDDSVLSAGSGAGEQELAPLDDWNIDLGDIPADESDAVGDVGADDNADIPLPLTLDEIGLEDSAVHEPFMPAADALAPAADLLAAIGALGADDVETPALDGPGDAEEDAWLLVPIADEVEVPADGMRTADAETALELSAAEPVLAADALVIDLPERAPAAVLVATEVATDAGVDAPVVERRSGWERRRTRTGQDRRRGWTPRFRPEPFSVQAAAAEVTADAAADVDQQAPASAELEVPAEDTLPVLEPVAAETAVVEPVLVETPGDAGDGETVAGDPAQDEATEAEATPCETAVTAADEMPAEDAIKIGDVTLQTEPIWQAWRGGMSIPTIIHVIGEEQPHLDAGDIRSAVYGLIDRLIAERLTAQPAPVVPAASAPVIVVDEAQRDVTPDGAADVSDDLAAGTGLDLPAASAETTVDIDLSELAVPEATDDAADTVAAEGVHMDPPSHDWLDTLEIFSLDDAPAFDLSELAVPEATDDAADTIAAEGERMNPPSDDLLAGLDDDTLAGVFADTDAAPAAVVLSDDEPAMPLISDEEPVAAIADALAGSSASDELPVAAPTVRLSVTSSDDDIWAAWQADMPLDEMIHGLCGFYDGQRAAGARERIHLVVIPRIVAEMDAYAVVERLVKGRKVTKNQEATYAALLQRLNRRKQPAGGAVRTATHDRLVRVMRPVLARVPAAA
ncbi:MAG: hypothetical protein M3R24_21500 [Chloroflexota bacterium]|nr:hypothetical protein [Chloroflexota bacterium]